MPDLLLELFSEEIPARMQDLEFTVEDGKLWMLQTRNGKRTAKAALRIAVELANEGLISKKDAVSRIDPASLDQLLHPTIDPAAKRDVVATGLPASPGAAAGEIVFSSDEATKLQADGRKVILVRIETSPEDIHGMMRSADPANTEVAARVETPKVESAKIEPVKNEAISELRRSTD